MLPAERPAIANVAVTRVIAPSQGMSGESVNLKVSLENQNNRPIDGMLTLTRNGQPFKTDRIKLRPGSQSFSYQANLVEGALTAYRASFAAADTTADLFTPDNHALVWINVRTKAKVLIVNGPGGTGRYLDEIARRQGFDVVSSGAEGAPAPAGHKIVIFNNVPRERFSAAYLASVERHVAGGGSFLMLGADASFAQNSYRQTPIEKILPVEPKVHPKQPEKNRAVVLVIDKSGSMRDDNRILYAKEAAKGVARRLQRYRSIRYRRIRRQSFCRGLSGNRGALAERYRQPNRPAQAGRTDLFSTGVAGSPGANSNGQMPRASMSS